MSTTLSASTAVSSVPSNSPSLAGPVAGGVVSGIAFGVLVGVLLVYFWRRRHPAAPYQAEPNVSGNYPREDMTFSGLTYGASVNSPRSVSGNLSGEL